MGNSKSQNLERMKEEEANSEGSITDEDEAEDPIPSSERTSLDMQAEAVDHRLYSYPFENLVFEGGGAKGVAYCGALQELEELGVLKQIKRFAGASIGAITASLLAVEVPVDEVIRVMSLDVESQILDHSCGYLSLLPNLLRYFGWNPGNGIYRWFRRRMYEATQNGEITFKEIYDRFGTELCVILTNLNQMNVTYCHVKTTPNMPVVMAVRMSTSIPGLIAARSYTIQGQTDTFIDGGLLCNYPIHCYDGWWLSMEPEDSFLKRLQPLSKLGDICENKNRFKVWNEKTVGLLVYNDDEGETYRSVLEARKGTELLPFPNTKISRRYKKARRAKKQAVAESDVVLHAFESLLRVLAENDLDNSSTISPMELETAFSNPSFTSSHRKTIFGRNVTAKEAFYIIRDGQCIGEDKNHCNRQPATEKTPIVQDMHLTNIKEIEEEISYQDIVNFLETNGVNVLSRVVGFDRSEIRNFAEFLSVLTNCIVTNMKRIYMTEKDVRRSVGINTGYLDTTDFKLGKRDVNYLIEQGRRSLVAFLKYYVVQNKPPLKKNTAMPLS